MNLKDLGGIMRKLMNAAGVRSVRIPHPKTGQPMTPTGVSAANPPRHETESLTKRKP